MVLESNTLDVLFVKDGQQGEDGKILYTWIKYAKDASGTGITDDPNGAIYIGISYNNESSIESNDPTQYAWTKIQGADGKKGEDAYTIFLENENISFATDKNRNPLSEQAYTSGITIMKGAKPVTDFTIGDIVKTQGIAVAKTDTAIAISVVNGNPLPNDSGEIEIPITVGGTVFKKILTWTCAKKGDQGIQGPQGERGENGKDGISPKVSLSKSGNTTTISIVDATGTHTQSVKDGTNGTPGTDGKDGKTSYFHVKYSNDGGKTFTGNSGEDTGIYMGSYTDYTEADSTDVKKYNWVKVKGDKGDTGQKGQDGTSIKITSKSVTYQTSTSGTTAPTGTWSTTVPTVNNGQYLWTKTTVQYSDGNKTEAYSVSYKGTNGTNGTSVTVSKTEVTYQVSTNGTTAPTGTWSTTMPSCDQGQYLWTKTYVKYSDGKETTSYSVSYKGVDGEKFAFNMLRETNQGSKHWVNMGASGKYSVESITTEDSINAVKLICTEPIASNEWQFCDFSDYEMLKSLKASTTYTLSYDIKTNRSGKILHNIKTGGGQKVFFANDIACKVLGNETWEHVSLKMTSGTTLPNLDGQVIYMFGDALSKVGYSIIKNLKLTEGIIDTPWAPHPEDLEGRGVSETVQYYLATSQASGVTSSTSGWSTDITTQKLTADKKYLWNCYQTKYSDGTSEPISTPKVIGVYGDKGTSTKIIRTGYKYTQNNIDTFSASGYSRTWGTADATTGLKVGDNVLLRVKNTTKGSDCLIFASITAIPSNYSLTCTSYGLIDNGADGQDGEDGAGFHWNLLKYSGDLSKQVLGGAGTYTATVESIEDKTTPSGQAEKITYTVQGTGGKFIQTGKYIKEGDIKQGKTYTVSVWCKCSSIKSTGVINAEFLDNKTYVNPTLSTEWQQYVVTGVANKDVTSTSSASAISFYYSDNMSVGDIFYISSPKVEEGDKASPWCTTYEETLAKNLSITPSSQYFKSTDGGKTFAPNAITIKPTIQGEINFGKWQYSIDGGVSFADVVSGQKGLTVSNNVLTVSKDSSLYSDAVTMITFRAVADDSSFYDTCSIAKIYDVSDIGDGRNLLWNSNFAKTDEAITGTTNNWGLHTRGTNLVASIDTSTKHNGFNTLKTVSAANGDKNSSNDLEWFAWGISERTSDNLHSKNQNYTLSFYAKASVTTDFIVRWGYDAYGADTTRTLTTNWQKYEIKLHQATSAYSITIIFKLLTAGTVWFSEFKLEKGSSATGYSTAPEDLQTAILSTKSEISDVSLKVDKNKQAIEQRVEKTTYEQDLNLVKGDISKANEGLNKWRYEIYPKSLFASEYQGKSTMDVFAKNTNLTPSQSVLINDTDLSIAWNYAENYIGYALTFAKFSAAKSVAITFAHDDGAHIYLNGKLIGGNDVYNNKGESLTLGFVKGWNCIEVVVNEGASTEGFKLGTTISALSECQLMNCYYGTPVARQSHITNQLVQNTTDIKGISTKVSKVTSVIGEDGKNFTDFKNDYSDFKQTMNGFKTTVGQTYVTKDDFDDLQIGGRNLLLYSANLKNGYYTNIYDTADETFKGCSVFKVNHAWNGIRPYFNKHITERNVIKAGDVLTYSVYAKTDDTKEIDIMMFNRTMDSDSGQGAIRGNQGELKLSNDWKLYSVTFKVTESMLSVDKGLSWFGYELCNNTSSGKYVYFACPKLENSNKPTDWTPAPEDVNGKIVNVETIANQTANKLEWIVKGGDSSSNFTLTDRVADLVAERINFKGLVTFSGLSTDAKSDILNSFEVGGRNLVKKKQIQGIGSAMLNLDNFLKNGTIEFNVKSTNDGFKFDSYDNYEPNSNYVLSYYFTKTNGTITKFGGFHNGKGNIFTKYTVDGIDYESSGYSTESSTVGAIMNDGNRHRVVVCFTTPSSIKTDDAVNFTYIQPGRGNNNPNFGVKIEELKLEKGNKATDWTPAPEDVSQDATNKASQALTDAKNYSSNAVNWVASNGSSTTSLNSMVKKWTDGAVSDTAQINGGWIKANTITASKIAIGDFTNYCQLDKDTASSYGFTATDDTKGVWFTASPIDGDKSISQWFTCEGGQKLYVEYDLSTTVKGKLKASDTDISYLTSGIMIFVTNGTKEIISYTRSKGVTATSDGAITHISVVETLPADARFFKVVLQTDGQRNTFSGTLKIRNPQVRKATTGKLIVDGSITADKIATDAIKSRNYISSGGTQGSFLNLSDGSFTSPNLSWDSNGNLIAKNANLSGEITATKGKIGKYTITDQWLITGSGSTASGFGGNQAFWAGSSSSNDAPFRVGYNGKLYANGATISGDITATTGKIGDLTLKDGILTGTGSYSEPYTEDDDGTVTSTITTNYITKLFGKGLTIDSTVKYSDEDDVYSYKVSVLPDEISFTDGEEIGMLGAGGLQILQVNDNSDSYSSEANEVSLSSGASNFYYTTPVNQTTDKYLHVCFSADGASFMASQGDKFNSFDIGYSSAKYSGNFAANKFVYTGNSLNYVECLEANDTTNVYFHSSGYYSFRVNNEGNWSNETQSVYITERGISVPGKIGLYSQEMNNYVARYYVAGSTKSTAIGNNSYQTRIYGSSVWANKAVSTSDVRLKQDFQSLDKFEDLYMQLQPVSFKYIDGYDKSEDRYFGLKAQPTEKLFEDMGENPDDYAMFNKFGIDHEDIKERIGYDVDFDEEHGLDYTNLITLNTHMVQKTRRELAELQKENAELKDMLKTIVKKINM